MRRRHIDQAAIRLTHEVLIYTDCVLLEGELGEYQVAKKCSLSPRARYALALKATSRIAADNLISAEEKSRLKDLILSDDEKIVAALECYEMDQDIEEMLDTLYRVAKVSP